jgi:translation initiation factor IF-3
MKAFQDFYINERDLQGKHKVISIIANGNKVKVMGQFTGKRVSSGAPVDIVFSDFFEFEKEISQLKASNKISEIKNE